MSGWKADGGSDIRAALRTGTEKALAFLDRGGADEYLEASLVKYSVGRFKLGLQRFSDILDRLSCRPGMRMLDLGCGAGNWSIAHAIRSQDAAEIRAVDRRDGFARLGADLASVLGLENVTFRCGSAEDEAMYGGTKWADFVLANSFMMFVNVDQVVTNIVDALCDGGTIYGNYTTAAGRLASALSGIERKDLKTVTSSLSSIFGSAQVSVGLNLRSPSCALTAQDLTELFEIRGFRLVESPGVHDWGATAAVGGVYDFVLAYDGGSAAAAAAESSRLLELGAHETLLARTAGKHSGPDGDLRARARIARYGAAGVSTDNRITQGMPANALLLGQRYLERTATAADTLTALRAEQRHGVEPPLVSFLIGMVALQSGDHVGARNAFGDVRSARPTWSGGWIGEMLALCGTKQEPDAEIGTFFARMVQTADFGLQPDDNDFRRRALALA